MRLFILSFIIFLVLASPVSSIEIIFGGDVTLARNLSASQKKFFTPQARQRIEDADLFIWNAEFSGLSKTQKNNRFIFLADASEANGMKFPNGLALVANNHSFDGNIEGFSNLVKGLQKAEIPFVGLKAKNREDNYVVANVGGRDVYVLNFTPMSRSGDSEWDTPSFEDILASMRKIEKIRKAGDIVIVCIHDGVEGTTKISDRQRNHVDRLAKAGADIVAYTHTHTYIDPAIHGDTLVLWGLGNFIFGGNSGWRNREDMRAMSVDPDRKTWKWLKGRTKEYVFDLK